MITAHNQKKVEEVGTKNKNYLKEKWKIVIMPDVQSYMHRQARIVGFLQSVNQRKDENPTRKTCSEYFKSCGWQK